MESLKRQKQDGTNSINRVIIFFFKSLFSKCRLVHALCALYTPNVAYQDTEKLWPVVLDEIPFAKWGEQARNQFLGDIGFLITILNYLDVCSL